MQMFELADQLDRTISASPRMPLTNLALLREQELVALLARLRAAVPAEALTAHRHREECERIVARGQADAESILASAQAEVERIVRHPHLLRDARERAAEVLRAAEVRAEMVRSNADTFVSTTLESLHRQLTDLEVQLARSGTSIQGGIAALNERVIPAARRGEVPLAAGKPALVPGDVRVAFHIDRAGSAPTPEPSGPASSPAPDSPLA